MGKRLLSFLGLGKAREPRLTVQEFRDRVARAIDARYPGAATEIVDEVSFETRFADGESATSNVTRAFVVYDGNPGELENIVQAMAASAGTGQTKATAEALVVVVRPDTYNPALRDEDPLDRGVTRPVAGDLLAIVAIDTPESYVFRHASDLREDLGMSDEEIWARALSNTLAVLDRSPPRLRHGRAELSDGSGLTSSLLADHAYWDGPEMAALGPLVVAPLARDSLLVARRDDEEAVDGLRELMDQVADDPNGFGALLLVRRDGAWAVLDAH